MYSFDLVFIPVFCFELGYLLGSCPKMRLQGLCDRVSQASCCSFLSLCCCSASLSDSLSFNSLKKQVKLMYVFVVVGLFFF